LQNAFAKSEGVTQEVRTDSLSAAYKNTSSVEDFTASYQGLITHYGFIATPNNTGVAHENGAIESSHRHIKSEVKQALKVRGSFDFICWVEYEAFVQSVTSRRNKRIAANFAQEQRQLLTRIRTSDAHQYYQCEMCLVHGALSTSGQSGKGACL
jgi:hypothetical protein